jgi:hypothetical protein
MLLLMSRAEGDVLYQRGTNRCVTPERAQRVAGEEGERIMFRHFDPLDLSERFTSSVRLLVEDILIKGADRRNWEGYELTRTERTHTRQRRRGVWLVPMQLAWLNERNPKTWNVGKRYTDLRRT